MKYNKKNEIVEPTYIDKANKLEWQLICPEYEMNWSDANEYAERLEYGGHSDWRLPTIQELKTLVDDTKCNPACIDKIRDHCKSSNYWSCHSIPDNTSNALVVNFYYGNDSWDIKSGSNYVMGVRVIKLDGVDKITEVVYGNEKEYYDELFSEDIDALYPDIVIEGRFNANMITLDNFEGIKEYRKKPIVVHCLQITFPEGFIVDTLEGRHYGNKGDYLMFGIEGEKYICKKEIFEKTYDIIVGNKSPKDTDKLNKISELFEKMTPEEYEKLYNKYKKSGCKPLSDFNKGVF